MSASQSTAAEPMQTGVAIGTARRGSGWLGLVGRWLIGSLSVLAGLVVWQILSGFIQPLFLPSPLDTWQAAVELARDGTLEQAIVISLMRILSGWAMGVVVGVPMGLLMGCFSVVRRMFEPYIQFFRFIPPIAFVTLAVIWLGPGEISKISLIFYTSVFIVVINTMAGVSATSALRLRAAASLGAGRARILLTVVVPSTVPYIVTGARIAMGNSFLTIVSAEIVAAQRGLGALIWTARNYARTEWVFVGIITLGILGFFIDHVLSFTARRLLRRYDVAL